MYATDTQPPVPSTLVHVAIGGLVGAALLGDRFSTRAIAVVLAAAAVSDLDSFVALAWPGAHRTLLHTLLLPAVLAGAVYYDTRIRESSWVARTYGPGAAYVAWVALAALLLGGVLPDLMTNGVNALWPLHDQFYTVNGKLVLSDQRGVVQTFVDLTPEKPTQSTKNLRYTTGVDPAPWGKKRDPEHTFAVVTAGWQLLVVLSSAFVVGVRTVQSRRREGSPAPGESDRER